MRPSRYVAALAALALLLPAVVVAADKDAWQGSQAESRARSGNPKLKWGTRSDADSKANSRSQARRTASKSGTSKNKHVVPAGQGKGGDSRITLRAVAATKHQDEAVEPAGAPLLRSANQPRRPAAEEEEDEIEDGRSYDELPEDDEPLDDAEMTDDLEGADDLEDADEEEPAELDRPANPRPLPNRRAPLDDFNDDADEELPALKPEPANAPKRPLPDCETECPKQSDPALFRALMEISLNMSDPTQDLSKAPSDYIDGDGLGPDDPVFQRGEKFVPRRSFRRCWNDSDGSQFQGWFVEIKDDHVRVIDEDKKEHLIPVGQLSLRDRRYLYHLPGECPLDDQQFMPRAWCLTNYTWKASALCHKPLYFEQVNYERYGHTWGPVIDPVLQGAHFFTSIAFLPYNMGIEPPQECIYPLGYYRPNSCAPYMLFPVPISLRGAVFQAGAVTGVAWLFH
ncbi:MAG: hypothetical protein AB7O62_22595 [Pirellulales bacterium]